MKYPSKEQTMAYLDEANEMNPGLWYKHSINAGEAAYLIAKACDDLNESLAFALGALHDIGRREGVTHLSHVIDGYKFMMSEGYSCVAKICLTHSFPNPNIEEYLGAKDCSTEDIDFLVNYLNSCVYDDYDRLIQLCDALGDTKGFCLVEKRLMETGIRHGANEQIRFKWQGYMKLVEYFNQKVGMSIYKLLPGVVGNTFGYE